MKTIQKILATIIILAGTLLKTSIIFSQCLNTVGGLVGPLRVEVQAPTGGYACVTNGSSICSPATSGTQTLLGMGVNNNTNINYMLDILCDPTVPTNLDVNIACPNCTPADAVGYRIGGNMFLWYKNSTSNAFCGVQAGNSISLTGGANDNAYFGYQAGYSDIIGEFNTFIGSEAGWSDLGNNSNGSAAGDYNVFVGNRCGYFNTSGQQNCYYGVFGGYQNVTGSDNCEFGDHSGQRVGGNLDSNSFYGFETGFNMRTGNSNVFIGDNSGWNTSKVAGNSGFFNTFVGGFGGSLQLNPGGNYNVTLGYGADAYSGTASSPGTITNAVAIGAEAWVQRSNQFMLGNNTQCIGIGMNMSQTGPMANLEIRTDSTPAPFGISPGTYGYIGNGYFGTGNYYGGTGFSGLKFWDLNSQSTPVDPASANFTNPNTGLSEFPTGVLSVDYYGNVIYVPGGIPGPCLTPSILPASVGYDLQTNKANFCFEGGSTNSAVTDVIIGTPINTCPTTPPAKLNVYQTYNITANPSIGVSIVNTDLGPICGTYPTSPSVIGIQSILPATVGSHVSKVAGWFEADKLNLAYNCCTGAMDQYAIYVPHKGGDVAVGYVWNSSGTNTWDQTCPSYRLDIFGTTRCWGNVWASDSTVKTNVTPISSEANPLSIIQKLKGVSFNYIDSVITDSGMGGTHYGFIAQQVSRVLPSVVKTDNKGLEAVAYIEIIPWLVEGLKQEKETNDSLRSAFQSIQNCLNQLCNNEHGAIHQHGGGSGDSNTTNDNIQDVTLSALSERALLYQNSPNPFSTGTKINYYLPANTQGASIVFYDTYGNQLKTVQLSQTGNGTLNITPDNLTSGIYSYSLVVNGNIIDTKRMILQK